MNCKYNVSVENYNVTWHKDAAADYKFFHKTNSLEIPGTWRRYPFADIFIYKNNKERNIYSYRNSWKDAKRSDGKTWGEIGFNSSLKWPNNTVLTKFGYYKMRVSVDNKKYLEKAFGPNWHDIGVTSWYDHYKEKFLKTISFEIPTKMYRADMPYI